jgi:hypothetical protein
MGLYLYRSLVRIQIFGLTEACLSLILLSHVELIVRVVRKVVGCLIEIVSDVSWRLDVIFML